MSSAAAALSGAPASAPAAASAPVPGPAAAAPIPSGTPAASPAPATANGDAWFSGIPNNDVRVWAEAKGWKDPHALAESAYNLEKLMGFDKAGRTIVMPGENASPEELKAFHAKIGVPETAEGYGLKLPEGQTDDSFLKQAAGWMHQAGVPAGAAQKLAEQWNGYISGQQQQAEQAFAASSASEMQSWQAEQGQALNQNLELARRATMQFLPEKSMVGGQELTRAAMLDRIEHAIGTGNMMKLFSSVGSGLSEHKLIQGSGGGVMTPAQAQQRINELKSNQDWTKAYLNGDKGKAGEMQQLIALAYPETGA